MIQKMMKAVQVAITGDAGVLHYTTVPKPTLAPNQVLIKNTVAGVNMIDTHYRTGLCPLPMPFIAGREGVGVIEEVSSEVTHLSFGDRVAYISAGSFAEYTAVNTSRVYRIPNEISDATAASAMIQGMTALALASKAYTVKPNDWILVHAAAGGTGGLIVQIAKSMGAHIIGTTSSDEKVKEGLRLGADHMVRYDNVVEKVMQVTKGQGVHAVFDSVGSATFSNSLKCLKPSGYFVSFGHASGKVPPFDLAALCPGNVYACQPSMIEYVKTPEQFEQLASEVFSLIRKKSIEIRIHKSYALDQVAEAHKEIEGGKTLGKILLTI